MRRFLHLYVGELRRLIKYKIVFFSLLVSLIWVAIVVLSDKTTAVALVPTLIGMDAGMMSIILLGASFYFEKQEGTIHSLLVSPVPVAQVLLAKVLSAISAGLVSMLMVAGLAWIVHGAAVSFGWMALVVIVMVASHTAIGYVFILISKDFMSMLVRIMGVLLLFYVPAILVPLGIITEEWLWVALLSPTYAGSFLLESLYKTVSSGLLAFAALYLTAIAGVIYPLAVYPRFLRIAVEG
ncbi:MAG TPA: ABC transporter permease [Candidatus Izemoplasmatales bacterium]|nr:ABC transporter permease [Bacillota bacterium]HRY78101.1 ABC transporter permease [Candidatus Izemoplasmatales bacterium]